MKKATTLCLVSVLFLQVSFITMAQSNSSHLTRVADRITDSIQEKKSEWKHTRGTPMTGSEDVVIDQWASGTDVIVITLMGHTSNDEAGKALKRLIATEKINERLNDLGEEAYSWNIHGSVVFRKSNITIYVNTSSSNLIEEAKLNKEFARLVAAALPGH